MRRWTVFVAALVVLSMLLPGDFSLAKSTQTDHSEKKTAAKAESSVKSSPKKDGGQSSKSTRSAKSESKKDVAKQSSQTGGQTGGQAGAKSDGKAGSKSAGKPEAKSDAKSGEKAADTAKSKSASKSKKRAASEPRESREPRQAKAAPPALPDSYKGEFGVDTKAALVMDMQTGRVLFAQEPDMPIPPASLTKVLTLFLINERLREGSLKLDETIPVSQEASHAGGSTMRLKTGESVTLDDLIKGIAIASANDGCVAVAEYLGKGDTHPFVEAMNRKAKEIGMANSQFFNPNGLPAEGQVTTARDMAVLAQTYLKTFPETLSIHSMTEFTRNNRVRHNSNSLLGKVEGVDGLKTGFVCASGFNIVVTAKRGDTRLVAVVLGAKNRRIREREATRLVEEGFKIVAAERGGSHQQVAMSHGKDPMLH
ncbi:MAG: D-alanyl-D-alanine carboxypeptidase [Desulfovibrionaceae bacterium]|nr:MAG: D-alanyl-D-alanine carboxypeptidase [Desulfovibrionaceae bacterium]